MKISFESDYCKGAHPKILESILKLNDKSFTGYGEDEICEIAKDKIRECIQKPEADIFFTVGGTQTNEIVIRSLLFSYEGVIAAQTGHINVHEAGAIEASGHKVLTLPSHEGKIDPQELESYLEAFSENPDKAHMVFPGMIYLSYPTEYGTLYGKDELMEIRRICDRYGMKLYIDGARLGYGLMSPESEITIEELSNLVDVYYIGGTKMGALFGEAIVFPKGDAPKNFFTILKQNGALLAKGWLLGLQFDVLFTDGLYFEIGKKANEYAVKLSEILLERGYRLFKDSPTNQQFFLVDDRQRERLEEHVIGTYWEKLPNGEHVIRLTTSWSTSDEDIERLAESI